MVLVSGSTSNTMRRSFTFKGAAIDVPQVVRRLNVSHVLEGSVRKAGSRVRITAQLIDGAAGDHIWAERFDRELTDIFAIQDEISEKIVAALKLIGQQRPDAAVLDVSLRDGMVTPVALLLRHLDVPFVVASAYSRAALPDDVMLGDPPCLGKPTSGSEMLVAVGELLREGTSGRA